MLFCFVLFCFVLQAHKNLQCTCDFYYVNFNLSWNDQNQRWGPFNVIKLDKPFFFSAETSEEDRHRGNQRKDCGARGGIRCIQALGAGSGEGSRGGVFSPVYIPQRQDDQNRGAVRGPLTGIRKVGVSIFEYCS